MWEVWEVGHARMGCGRPNSQGEDETRTFLLTILIKPLSRTSLSLQVASSKVGSILPLFPPSHLPRLESHVVASGTEARHARGVSITASLASSVTRNIALGSDSVTTLQNTRNGNHTKM